MDSGGNVAGLSVHLRRKICGRKTIVAAALRELRGQVASLRGDGVIERERAVTDAVINPSQAVIKLAELLTEQNLLLAGSRGVLAELTLTIPAVAVEAPEEEEENNPPSTVTTKCAIIADSGTEVRKTVIIPKIIPFDLFYNQCAP